MNGMKIFNYYWVSFDIEIVKQWNGGKRQKSDSHTLDEKCTYILHTSLSGMWGGTTTVVENTLNYIWQFYCKSYCLIGGTWLTLVHLARHGLSRRPLSPQTISLFIYTITKNILPYSNPFKLVIFKELKKCVISFEFMQKFKKVRGNK